MRVFDAVTGAEIADVIEVDAGWYRALKRLPNGEPALTEDGRQVYTRRYGAIRVEPEEEAAPPRRGRRSASD